MILHFANNAHRYLKVIILVLLLRDESLEKKDFRVGRYSIVRGDVERGLYEPGVAGALLNTITFLVGPLSRRTYDA